MAFSVERKNLIVLLLGLLAAGGVLYASNTKLGQNSATKSPRPTADGAYHPKAEEPGAPTTFITPTPNPGQSTPTPAPSGPQSSDSGLITILSPAKSAVISSGTVVSGRAKIADGKLHWRVKGMASGQLGEGMYVLGGDPAISQDFSFTLAFTNQAKSGDTGELQVFSINPKDATEINVASLAVSF